MFGDSDLDREDSELTVIMIVTTLCQQKSQHFPLDLVIIRVAKCHGYGGCIRVKKLPSWGKKFGKTKKIAKTSHFWEDLREKFKIQ